MTRYLVGVAALALIAAPATAQLLGGGAMGGVVGALGGISNATAGGSLDRMPSDTDATSYTDRGTHSERRAPGGEAANGGSGMIAASTDVIGSASSDNRMRAQRGAVSGSAEGSLAVYPQSLPTRGVVAAERRGFERVDRTVSGVPVFVSRVVNARVVPVAYPVYQRGAYYGGSDNVFIGGDVGGYMDRQYSELRRGVAGTGATVSRRGEDLVVELPGDVTFAFDKADIRPRFVGTLSAVARILDTYRATDVEILGHTDSIGSDQYNLALSERRGRSVADFLVAQNAEPDRLVVEALGKSEPIASNATIAGRAANRRVEIVLHPRSG